MSEHTDEDPYPNGYPYENPLAVTAVEVLEGRHIRISFDDGLTRDVDVAPLLWGPIFDPIRDDDHEFAKATIEVDTLAWPEHDIHIAAEVLHGDYPPPPQPESDKRRVQRLRHAAHR